MDPRGPARLVHRHRRPAAGHPHHHGAPGPVSEPHVVTEARPLRQRERRRPAHHHVRNVVVRNVHRERNVRGVAVAGVRGAVNLVRYSHRRRVRRVVVFHGGERDGLVAVPVVRGESQVLVDPRGPARLVHRHRRPAAGHPHHHGASGPVSEPHVVTEARPLRQPKRRRPAHVYVRNVVVRHANGDVFHGDGIVVVVRRRRRVYALGKRRAVGGRVVVLGRRHGDCLRMPPVRPTEGKRHAGRPCCPAVRAHTDLAAVARHPNLHDASQNRSRRQRHGVARSASLGHPKGSRTHLHSRAVVVRHRHRNVAHGDGIVVVVRRRRRVYALGKRRAVVKRVVVLGRRHGDCARMVPVRPTEGKRRAGRPCCPAVRAYPDLAAVARHHHLHDASRSGFRVQNHGVARDAPFGYRERRRAHRHSRQGLYRHRHRVGGPGPSVVHRQGESQHRAFRQGGRGKRRPGRARGAESHRRPARLGPPVDQSLSLRVGAGAAVERHRRSLVHRLVRTGVRRRRIVVRGHRDYLTDGLRGGTCCIDHGQREGQQGVLQEIRGGKRRPGRA